MEKKKSKLALVDFDGTLFDTWYASCCAYNHALEEYGLYIEPEYFREHCDGGYYRNFLRETLGARYDELFEPVHDKKVADYRLFYGLMKENTPLMELLSALSDEYYVVIVSTGSKKSMTEILEHFGRLEIFDGIVDQKEVERKKPAPDAFLKAMELYGIGPENTVVFEDSQLGVDAAKAAGLQYFRVEKIV